MNFTSLNNLVTENGWTLVRQLGNVYQYKNKETEKVFTLSVSAASPVPTSVINRLYKITGLTL